MNEKIMKVMSKMLNSRITALQILVGRAVIQRTAFGHLKWLIILEGTWLRLLGSKYWCSWWLMASLRAKYRNQYCFNVLLMT